MDEAYAIRVLDALREAAAPAVRPHDGVHLLCLVDINRLSTENDALRFKTS